MKHIIAIVALSLAGMLALAQNGNLLSAGQHPGGGGGTTITVNLGGTMVDSSYTDSGDGLFIYAVPFIAPTPSSGSISVTSIGAMIGSPAAANWGGAIYTDSSGAPSSLVSNCSTFSNSTPSAPIAALTPTSCTLSSNTLYWAAAITVSNTQTQIRTENTCANGLGFGTFKDAALGSFTSTASWPSTFGASTPTTSCYGVYVTVQYTSTNTYDVAAAGGAGCHAGNPPGTCVFDIAPANSGHGLIVGTTQNGAGTVTSVTDSASDTITKRGTYATNVGTHGDGIGIASIDRVTAGVNTITVVFSGGNGAYVTYAEVSGTAASSSFDVSSYDGAYSATPFTSGNTGTTGQANEVLFGIAAQTNTTGTFAASGGWSVIAQGRSAANSSVFETGALFVKTVTSTGTQNLTGSYSVSGTLNLPGLATFK